MADEVPAFPEPTDAAIEKARKAGVLDAIQESTKDAFKAGTDQGYGDGGDHPPLRFTGSFEVAHLQDWLSLPSKELADRLDGKRDHALTESQIAGLLEMERSGPNRTEFVKVYMKRLGIKSPYEATDAGPAYTNDTTATSAL